MTLSDDMECNVSRGNIASNAPMGRYMGDPAESDGQGAGNL